MIPRNSIPTFTDWLRGKGYRAEDPKFLGEALRMRKPATSPLMYAADPEAGVLTGHTPRSLKMARLFAAQTGLAL